MKDIHALINAHEKRLAQDDDRLVDEFRDRHPQRVAALDALRDIADLCDAMDSVSDVEDRVQPGSKTSRYARGTADRIRDLIARHLEDA